MNEKLIKRKEEEKSRVNIEEKRLSRRSEEKEEEMNKQKLMKFRSVWIHQWVRDEEQRVLRDEESQSLHSSHRQLKSLRAF